MKHCLIVDDSQVMRLVTRHLLEELSYSVAEAEDGVAGLNACRQKMPDLIFLDWALSGMKGVEFIKRVRRLAQGESPMILLCATESDPAQLAIALAAGANDWLLKPFDGAALRAKLADIGQAA